MLISDTLQIQLLGTAFLGEYVELFGPTWGGSVVTHSFSGRLVRISPTGATERIVSPFNDGPRAKLGLGPCDEGSPGSVCDPFGTIDSYVAYGEGTVAFTAVGAIALVDSSGEDTVLVDASALQAFNLSSIILKGVPGTNDLLAFSLNGVVRVDSAGNLELLATAGEIAGAIPTFAGSPTLMKVLVWTGTATGKPTSGESVAFKLAAESPIDVATPHTVPSYASRSTGRPGQRSIQASPRIGKMAERIASGRSWRYE